VNLQTHYELTIARRQTENKINREVQPKEMLA